MRIENIVEKFGKFKNALTGLAIAGIFYACATPQTRTVIYPVYGQGPIVEERYKGRDFEQEMHLQQGKSYIKEKFITQRGDTAIKYYEFELGGKKEYAVEEGGKMYILTEEQFNKLLETIKQGYRQVPQQQKKQPVKKKGAYEKKDTSGRID